MQSLMEPSACMGLVGVLWGNNKRHPGFSKPDSSLDRSRFLVLCSRSESLVPGVRSACTDRLGRFFPIPIALPRCSQRRSQTDDLVAADGTWASTAPVPDVVKLASPDRCSTVLRSAFGLAESEAISRRIRSWALGEHAERI